MAKRPHLQAFLDEVTTIFECVFFTASVKEYADAILNKIDPQCKVKYRLYRDSCEIFEKSYIKNLDNLNRNINNIIIVDNSPIAFSL